VYTRRLANFKREAAGNVAPVFAAVLVPLVTAVGASIDYAGAFNLRTQVQAALDSLCSRRGREYQVTGDVSAAVNAAGVRFDSLVNNPTVSLTKAVVNESEGTVELAAEGVSENDISGRGRLR